MASSINYNIYRTLYISRGKYDAPWQEFLVSVALAISDFVSFIISIYLAMGLLSVTHDHNYQLIDFGQTRSWIALHWLLAFSVSDGIQCGCAIIITGKHFGMN